MIKVSGLQYVYGGGNGTRAVKGIDFEIQQGEVFGFLGPSGAGKTTTQRIIIGLLRNYSGSVEIMGKERRKWGKDYFEQIGVVFEFPNLYLKLTASENLALIASYYANKPVNLDVLLQRVGLLADKDRKVEGFSKGMKMRLNFIRGLLHDPKLIFLDEPTSGLDPLNAKIIKDMILEMKTQGKTVFLTTHNMTVAEQLCDRVAFIVDGLIPVIESPKLLKVQYGSRKVRVEYMGDGVETREYDLANIRNSEEYFDIMRTKDIQTIHSQEATLEDIFIRLTGRGLA